MWETLNLLLKYHHSCWQLCPPVDGCGWMKTNRSNLMDWPPCRAYWFCHPDPLVNVADYVNRVDWRWSDTKTTGIFVIAWLRLEEMYGDYWFQIAKQLRGSDTEDTLIGVTEGRGIIRCCTRQRRLWDHECEQLILLINTKSICGIGNKISCLRPSLFEWANGVLATNDLVFLVLLELLVQVWPR